MTQENKKTVKKSEYEKCKEMLVACAEERAKIDFDDDTQFATLTFNKYTKVRSGATTKQTIQKGITLRGVSVKNVPSLVERCIDI